MKSQLAQGDLGSPRRCGVVKGGLKGGGGEHSASRSLSRGCSCLAGPSARTDEVEAAGPAHAPPARPCWRADRPLCALREQQCRAQAHTRTAVTPWKRPQCQGDAERLFARPNSSSWRARRRARACRRGQLPAWRPVGLFYIASRSHIPCGVPGARRHRHIHGAACDRPMRRRRGTWATLRAFSLHVVVVHGWHSTGDCWRRSGLRATPRRRVRRWGGGRLGITRQVAQSSSWLATHALASSRCHWLLNVGRLSRRRLACSGRRHLRKDWRHASGPFGRGSESTGAIARLGGRACLLSREPRPSGRDASTAPQSAEDQRR